MFDALGMGDAGATWRRGIKGMQVLARGQKRTFPRFSPELRERLVRVAEIALGRLAVERYCRGSLSDHLTDARYRELGVETGRAGA